MARVKSSTTSTTNAGAVKEAAPASVSTESAVVHTQPENGTVVVALNQPQGIIFRLFRGEGDTRSEYKRVKINGNAEGLIGSLDAAKLPRGGYGLTTIDAQDWNEIKKQYGMLPLFTNGLIFAASSVNNAQAQAKEQSEVKSGYEPIDPEREALTSPDKK